MRILHIISTLNPSAGGPSEGVITLCGYTAENYKGEVVTFDSPDAPYLKTLPFPVHPLGPVGTVYGYTSKLLPWLRENRDRFDGVIVNGMWQFCGLAALLTFRGKKPYMVFPHGMLDPYFKRRYPLKHLKKLLYWYPFEYWVLRNAFRVLFTTETERQLANETFLLHRWRGHVVPYGIRPAAGPPEVDIAAFEERLPELTGKRFLLFLSRIHPKKGCDLLIEAFCKEAETDPDLHLLMAGPGEADWIAKLKAIATTHGCAHRIHWPGIVRDHVKWGAFRKAEAFILPSHQENFGIAVAEALSCGLPLLVSDQINIVSMIDTDACAFVEKDTLAGTQNLVRKWIAASPQKRASMAQSSAETFRSRFDMRENAHEIIRLFTMAHGPVWERRRNP